MKKWLLSLIILAAPLTLKAETFLNDQIKTTLIDNIEITTLFEEGGGTRVALLDAVIQVGRLDGDYLLNGQAGFAGEVGEENTDTQGDNAALVAGGFFRLDLLLNKVANVSFPDHWTLLKAIQHGPAYHYNFRDDEGVFSYQVGLAFGLQPKT